MSSVTEDTISLAIFMGQSLSGHFRNSGPFCNSPPFVELFKSRTPGQNVGNVAVAFDPPPIFCMSGSLDFTNPVGEKGLVAVTVLLDGCQDRLAIYEVNPALDYDVTVPFVIRFQACSKD